MQLPDAAGQLFGNLGIDHFCFGGLGLGEQLKLFDAGQLARGLELGPFCGDQLELCKGFGAQRFGFEPSKLDLDLGVLDLQRGDFVVTAAGLGDLDLRLDLLKTQGGAALFERDGVASHLRLGLQRSGDVGERVTIEFFGLAGGHGGGGSLLFAGCTGLDGHGEGSGLCFSRPPGIAQFYDAFAVVGEGGGFGSEASGADLAGLGRCCRLGGLFLLQGCTALELFDFLFSRRRNLLHRGDFGLQCSQLGSADVGSELLGFCDALLGRGFGLCSFCCGGALFGFGPKLGRQIHSGFAFGLAG